MNEARVMLGLNNVDEVDMKSTDEIRRYVTEYYCAQCNEAYRFYDEECPECGEKTTQRLSEEQSINFNPKPYKQWFDAKSKKWVASPKEYDKWLKRNNRVDLHDTGQLKTPFIAEKIKETKWKIQKGLI